MTSNNERALALGNAILAATFETTIAKTKTFAIAMADMPDAAIMALLAHGTQRKFNDAVGGSDKTAETKVELATAMIADWKAGKLGKERAAGVPKLQLVIRRIVRDLVKKQASTEVWAKFDALEADEQAKKLDAQFAAMPEKHQAAVTAQAQGQIDAELAKQAQAKALADAVGDISFEL